MKRQLRTAEGVVIIATLITLLVCPGLYAAEETLPTPEEIIAKNIEAMGGIKALNKIKNKKIVQIRKPYPRNTEYKDTIYQERPNKFYRVSVDLKTPDRIERMGFNGKIVWLVNSYGTRWFEGTNMSNDLLFDGMHGPDARYKSMKTEGIEQINGKDCYKVVKTPEKGPEWTVYYDKNSFIIVKIVCFPMETMKMEFVHEYKKIKDILFEYKYISIRNGQSVDESIVNKIELNIEMPEGIFDIPEEVKVIMNKIMNQRQTGEWKKFVGTWKGTVPGPDRNAMDITYVFDSSEYMTGSVSTKLGEGPFYGWLVEGNKISFSVHRPDAIVHTNGTLSGDVINMIQKNGNDVKEFIIKRVTE